MTTRCAVGSTRWVGASSQEGRVVAAAEALEHPRALPGSAVEVAGADVLSLEALTHLAEKAGELAEDERAVAAAGDVAELLDQRVELGAGDAVAALAAEAG